MKRKKWYRLDNAGKFYSFTNKSQIPAVFRYSVTLTEEIDSKILKDALELTMKEFPNFNVHLRRGLFWHYLETANDKFRVEEENLPICFRIFNSSEDLLFRISYYKNRINLEISHILSDGRGSLIFFKNLIYKYLIIKYSLEDISFDEDSSSYEKSEDSFDKYYTKTKRKLKKRAKIYRYKARKTSKITYMEYHLPVDKVLEIAHSYHASLTSLLIAVLICSYKKEMKERQLNQTIKIDVPVDLRPFFNSSTSRNFFGLTSVSYRFKSKNDSFQDIVKSVNEQLKESVTIENLKGRMNQMISLEKNVFIRIAPLFLKNIILNLVDQFSTGSCTSCLSNIGSIQVDKKLEPYIENFNVLNATDSFKVTLCSYKNDLSIGMSSRYENNNITKTFCHYFAKQGINGVLNINWEDSDEKM